LPAAGHWFGIDRRQRAQGAIQMRGFDAVSPQAVLSRSRD
jgi:hypothetical protein